MAKPETRCPLSSMVSPVWWTTADCNASIWGNGQRQLRELYRRCSTHIKRRTLKKGSSNSSMVEPRGILTLSRLRNRWSALAFGVLDLRQPTGLLNLRGSIP